MTLPTRQAGCQVFGLWYDMRAHHSQVCMFAEADSVRGV